MMDRETAPSRPLPVLLTEQFYAWERRGRGWDIWPEPVRLEPAYAPFQPYFPQFDFIDDGRSPSWWQRLVQAFQTGPALPRPRTPEIAIPEYLAIQKADRRSRALCVLEISLPADFSPVTGSAEQLLLGLTYCAEALACEFLGTSDSVTMRIVCDERDEAAVIDQLLAFYPELTIRQIDEDILDGANLGEPWVFVDFGLSNEFMRPLRTMNEFDIDPLVSLLGSLAGLASGEIAVLQVLFEPARAPWAEAVFRSVTDWSGEDFFLDAPEMAQLAKQKIRSPLYAVVIRVAVLADTSRRAWDIVRRIGGGLAQFNAPASNELIPLTNDGYDNEDHEHDFVARQSRRTGMILNVEELAGLIHLPAAEVRADKFTRETVSTKAAPLVVQGNSTLLGLNQHRGKSVPVALNLKQRLQHMHVIGASGTGKSTLLLNLICQDLEHGHGLALLDPHGDLVDAVLARIPDARLNDVIFLDPSDDEYAVGINVLAAHTALEKNLLASDLTSIFQRLSTSWGDQMTTVLGNSILAMLESPQICTLADLRRFLVEPEFRRSFLKNVQDEHVVYYWQKEFPLLSGRPQGPILTRLDAFLRTKCLRHIVAQKTQGLDFANVLNNKKILLAKLSHGTIGVENASLLGSILIAKLNQAAFGRQQIPEAARHPYFLYLDEFHHFVTPSMLPLLTGARKYGVGLILAHQELHQLERASSDIASAVVGNAATRICFRVAESDARKLAEGYASFGAKDFVNLGRGEALVRVERASHDFSMSTNPEADVDAGTAKQKRDYIVKWTRDQYSRKREDIDLELSANMPQPSWSEAKAGAEQNSATTPDTPSAPEKPIAPIADSKPLVNLKKRREAPETVLLGKGGPEHKYLQQFIKRWGEGMGYRATIEKPIGNGIGSVDVALEKDARSIACEITVSTSVEHECANIQKCLDGGYEYVVVVSPDTSKLRVIQTRAESLLSPDKLAQVKFLTPEALFEFVEELEADAAGTEKTVRGYRVKVNYKTSADGEKAARKRAVSQVVVGALKRLRGKGKS